MKRYAVYLFLLSSINLVSLSAQFRDYTTFPTDVGAHFNFGEGTVTDIKEDWNGFIWLSTTNGLYRFDGTEVKRYERDDKIIPHSLVYSLLIDDEERVIWLATRGGLAKFDPENETSTIYRNDPQDPTSLADDLVRRVIKDREGNIWVSCVNRGLDLLVKDSIYFKHYFFDYPHIDRLHNMDHQLNLSDLNSFTVLTQDAIQDQVFWLGGPFGLIKFDAAEASFDWLDSPLKVMDEKTPESPIVELFARGDEIIVGHTAGAYIFNAQNQKITLLNTSTIKGDLIRATKITEEDGLIHIAFRNGLLQMDGDSKKVLNKWHDDPSLNQIYGVQLRDRNGGTWLYSSGLLQRSQDLNYPVQGYFLPEDHRQTPAIVKPLSDKYLILFTNQTASYFLFDLKSNQWIENPFRWSGRPSSISWQDFARLDSTHIMLLSRDKLFILNVYNGSIYEKKTDLELVRPRFSTILIDGNKDLWLGSLDHGLFRIHLPSGVSEHFSHVFNSERNSSAYTWITKLHHDKTGNIWIRLGRGFSVHQTSQSFKNFPIGEYAGHTFRYVRNFAENSRGEIWLSSEDRGIGKMSSTNLSQGITDFFTTNDGLGSNNIMKIAFDQNDVLWILSDIGIETFNPATREIQKMTWSLGIPHTDDFFFLPNGMVALTLEAGGIGLFHPGLLREKRPPPMPYLTKVRVRDRVIYQGNRSELNRLNILTKRDYLGFEFSALGFLNPKEFAYQLQGVDDDWIETTERQTASYSNLKPGNYNFLLKARNIGGMWSATNNIAVVMPPHWYETLWFKSLVLLLILASIYFIYRWRVDSIRQKERLKSEFQQKLNDVEMQALRAQMNPHFLFNSLNSIEHFIIKNQTREAVDYLNRFSRLVRIILQHSRTKVVTLKDEIDALKLYLDLENLRFKNKFHYSVNIDPTLNQHDIEVPPMLLQPFVENAIWHGLLHKKEPGNLMISIRKDRDRLICIIEDDGVGRRSSEKLKARSNPHRRSMGMNITRNRLDILNHENQGSATLDIKDLYSDLGESKGTRVEITLPA